MVVFFEMHLFTVICAFAVLINKVCYSNWESWKDWGSCSASCGYGVKYRTRNCNCNYCNYYYCYCLGSEGYEKTDCFEVACPVNGNWNYWATWNQCSTTCAAGTRRRDRLCNNPSPTFGGNTCPGNTYQTENCNIQPCPINGQWSPWSNWTICASCKNGYQNRTRECTLPAPAFGGKNCDGVPIAILHCSESCQEEQQEISGYSSGVVAGVAIACIIITLICVVAISIARKQFCPIGLKNDTLELDHNQQHQSPSVNNPEYAGQDNAVDAMEAEVSMDYNRIANQVQSTDDSDIYENMKI